MKINKLMPTILSGVLSVSMLVGCNNNEVTEQLPETQVQQETTLKQNESEKHTDEETKEEVKQQEQDKKSVEEKDKEIEEKYCDWCGAKAGHSTDEHVAQCYDCGEYKKASEMEYNGRSFHCGCIDQESTEELWVCPGCDGSYPESEMIEDTENGIWYCYGCYNEIMNYRMDGDANGDLEDWEY